MREDEEQKIKLQEIINLLVAAGYFRARIKGLSSFDKVMCKYNEHCGMWAPVPVRFMVYKVGTGAGFCGGMYWKYVIYSYVHLIEDDYLLHIYTYDAWVMSMQIHMNVYSE